MKCKWAMSALVSEPECSAALDDALRRGDLEPIGRIQLMNELVAAYAHVRNWHTLPVRCSAAIWSGIGGSTDARRALLRGPYLTQLRHWSLPEVAAQHPSWYPTESMSIMWRATG
jgi:hypothetical protein